MTDYVHSCGHFGTPSGRLSSKSDERYWSKRIAGEKCSDCVRAARAAKAADDARAADLPPLVGSPKQIAYGDVRRAAGLVHLKDQLAQLRAMIPGLPVAAQAEMQDALTLIERERLAETSASHWIEYSHDGTAVSEGIMREMAHRRLAPSVLAPIDAELATAVQRAYRWLCEQAPRDDDAIEAIGSMRHADWGAVQDIDRLSAVLARMAP